MRVAIYAFQPTNKIPTINSSSYVNATRARNSSSLRGTHPSNVRFRVALFQHPRLFTTDAVIVESQRETRCMSVHATIKEQVNPGLRRTAGWLAGMAWLGLVFWGIVEAFGTEANFSEGHHPSRVLGYFILVAAALIFVITANRWKRVLLGIMIAATLGSLLELARGHAVNNPSVLVPRSIAFVQLVVVVGVTALSFTFKNSPLNIVDRLALLACAASIYVGGEETIQQKVPLALIVGGACVFVAWVVDRLRTNRSNNFVAPGGL